ncbi:MAG: BamA/TamA family outer membrane protein, partial [Bacteroidota bacterium]
SLVITSLADADHVYHNNPEYYYIPKQHALKEYNAFFGDEVYLVEERPDDDRSEVESFGYSEDIISTPSMIEKLGSNIRHKVAQDWVVRARLFDLVIGDWDRHDDQWRWATFDVGSKGDIEVYRPIPRDRDQVFPNYDGLLVGIARFTQPILRQLDKYTPDIKSLKWSVYNTRHFDRSFMNELEWKDWEKEVKFIQDNLTDEVIDAAFAGVAREFKVSMKDFKFDEIKEVMKKRRDNLMDFAHRFYLLNAQKVDVVGTNDKELFIVDRLSDSLTRVRVYDTDWDTAAYERHFFTHETQEIHLYGLENDDRFLVAGKVNEGIKIRVIGGLGKDEMIDHSMVEGSDKKTYYYDFLEEENKLQSDYGELKDMRSKSLEKNAYDRKHPHYEFNFTRPLPLVGFNPDEGLSLGINALSKIYEFKKSPLGQLHNASLLYISALNTIDFKYKGELLSTFKTWDLIFQARAHGDRFAFNYFGLGNETENPALDDFDFNRTRQSQWRGEVGLRKRFLYDAASFSISTFIEETELQNTADRFIATQDFSGDLFDERYYTGILTSLDFTSVDNEIAPRRGANFHFSYDYQINLTDNEQSFGQLHTHLSMYFPIGGNLKYILATRIGTAINSGETDFFKRPFLGGNTNLRGFRAERFRGDATFYHNTDMRLKLFESINRVLPLTMGLHAGFDHGRVWLDDEGSNKWHYSYGGGIWFAPVNFVILSGGVYRSEEQTRVLVRVGHLF